MRAPFVASPDATVAGTTSRAERVKAHECFRGLRLLLVALAVSLGLWAGFGWGLGALLRLL